MDEVEHVVLLAEIEDLRDVDVLDAGREPCLVEEHALKASVLRVLRQDGLDGDDLLEAALAAQTGDPDAGHPAFGDRAEHLVAVELVAGRDRRRSGRIVAGGHRLSHIPIRPVGAQLEVIARDCSRTRWTVSVEILT